MSYHSESLICDLQEKARFLRIESLKMICRRKAGHPGGTLSAADIMAVLFFRQLRIDSQNVNWPERDRFILSKGHASAALYVALAMRGFFSMDDLAHWGELDCHLQGHPDRLKTPGVEMSTGILGHGIAIGAGMALAGRFKKMNHHVYVLLGDGECQAGIVWEGANLAAKYRLSNLTAIVDYNDVQLDGAVHEIMPLEPMRDKWKAFNWFTLEINGHDIRQILEAFDSAMEIQNRPTIIIAHTIKGKGVSFMENKSYWHGVAPNEEQLRQAIHELEGGK